MVSEAVEEVLNLVQNATQTFKSMMSCDSSDACQGNVKFQIYWGKGVLFSFMIQLKWRPIHSSEHSRI